ncbi:MAG TPA: hypothetical protein DCM86_06045 [Verrucomicrobiales bacterium]|nr:hypothetical protein [Verrucomicrobiales bacterium]
MKTKPLFFWSIVSLAAACALLSSRVAGQGRLGPNLPPEGVVRVWHASPTLTDLKSLHFYVLAPLGEDAVVPLDARDSYDPEGGPLVFEWSELDEGEHRIGDSPLILSGFRGDDDSSVHRLKLLVVDQGGERDVVEFKLTVLAPEAIVEDLADYLSEPATSHLAVRHRMVRALRSAQAAFTLGKAGARRGSIELALFLNLARTHPGALGDAGNQRYTLGIAEELLHVVRGSRHPLPPGSEGFHPRPVSGDVGRGSAGEFRSPAPGGDPR